MKVRNFFKQSKSKCNGHLLFIFLFGTLALYSGLEYDGLPNGNICNEMVGFYIIENDNESDKSVHKGQN
jgi:hypothetical protein